MPFYPPMAGSGGAAGIGAGQPQERERTTWLSEDEDVWGTEPEVGPPVLGRDRMADDETDDYDDFDEVPARRSRRDPSRVRGR